MTDNEAVLDNDNLLREFEEMCEEWVGAGYSLRREIGGRRTVLRAHLRRKLADSARIATLQAQLNERQLVTLIGWGETCHLDELPLSTDEDGNDALRLFRSVRDLLDYLAEWRAKEVAEYDAEAGNA